MQSAKLWTGPFKGRDIPNAEPARWLGYLGVCIATDPYVAMTMVCGSDCASYQLSVAVLAIVACISCCAGRAGR